MKTIRKHTNPILAASALIFSFAYMLSLSHISIAQESHSKQLRPFNAQYTAYRSGNDIGSASLSLVNLEDENYKLEYSSSVSRFFLSDKRFETTVFNVHSGQLTPITYHYERTGTGPNKKLSANFSNETQLITLGDNTSLNWEGEFDNQLFRIDFPLKLAKGEQTVVYDFLNYRGEKRQYIMQVVANDNLDLPYGKLTAYKVKIDRKSNSRVTFAWFAPSLGYNLVRLQQFKDGKEQGDIQLSTFSYH